MGGWGLGIDLGTTYTCAAVCRASQVEVVALGDRAAVIPSVLFLRDDGGMLVGEAAERRALDDPTRVVRWFKRRIGDPTPVLVAGTPYPVDVLTARLLRWVVDRVVEREGDVPDRIVVTHPANWGAFKLDVLRQAVGHADLAVPVELCSEPVAAALTWASRERVEDGTVVAVYDLGGGTFDAAVLRKTAAGAFDVLGTPQGLERFGGIDLDTALLEHVDRQLDGAIAAADLHDPEVVASAGRLRRDLVEAKEALSADFDTAVPVAMPGLSRSVRVTRAELESLARPALAETVVALRRAIDSAGLAPPDVAAVLLVGGASRMPIVAQLVSEDLGRPVAVDAHPKHAIALGAALFAGGRAAATAPAAAPAAGGQGAPTPDGPQPVASASGAPARRRRLRWAAAAAVVSSVAAGALLLGRGDGDGGADGEPAEELQGEPDDVATTTNALMVFDPLAPPSSTPSGRTFTGPSGPDGALDAGDVVLGEVPIGEPVEYRVVGRGARLAIGIEGFMAIDETFEVDPVVQVLDDDGEVVDEMDDRADGNLDPLVFVTIPDGETWTVVVRELEDRGGWFAIFVDAVPDPD